MSEERASKKQRELLMFVDGFIKGNGYGPSYREIMRSLGYKSVSTVAVHIDGLIKRGYLRKRDNSARSIEVISTQFEEAQAAKDENQLHAEWLRQEISGRIDRYRQQPDVTLEQEIITLLAAAEVLHMQDVYQAASRQFAADKTSTSTI